MSPSEPEPSRAETAELFAAFLRYYRETAITKVAALPEAEQRTSRLPTGWSPLELLNHLAHMERRWFVWGFLGEDVDHPWGDDRDGRWTAEDLDVAAIARHLRAIGARTTEILGRQQLDDVGRVGGRFDDFPPSLRWICFHVLQEYARHVGHLDVVVELAGGPVGE